MEPWVNYNISLDIEPSVHHIRPAFHSHVLMYNEARARLSLANQDEVSDFESVHNFTVKLKAIMKGT